MDDERRKFLRLNVLTDVIYAKMNMIDKGKVSLARNISQGGICIICYEQLKESEILDLKICLPQDNAPINAVGRVIWSKEFIIGNISTGKRYDVGVEFIKINTQDLDKLNKYLFSLKPV